MRLHGASSWDIAWEPGSCPKRHERWRMDVRTRLPNAWMGEIEEGGTRPPGESAVGRSVLERVRIGLIESWAAGEAGG
jgi:hypothetical protein